MIGSLYSGISGLKANTDAMAVIGDNIANVNTTGFKSSKASFADVLSGVTGKEIGQGVIMLGQDSDWTQGAPESTGNATDLAITGDGLFVVRDSTGAEYYTRAGNFQFDNAGNLVTHNGMIVQGYEINPATGVLGAIGNISITSGNSQPLVTGEMSVNLNLNADDTNGLDESVGSTLTVDCTNTDSDITFTAVNGGAAGNNITVKYVDPGASSQDLSIDVTGNAITVNLATDSTGAITSTASEIAAKIEEVGTPSAELVTAAVQGSGDGVVNAATYLSSGDSGCSSATNLIGGVAVTAAELEVDCTNTDSDITFTAQAAGAAGNNITVKYVDPGAASQALGVVVAGNAITVNLATNNLGVITSTAEEVAIAVNAATSLVSAPEEGDGVVNAATYFSGGGSGCSSDTNLIGGDAVTKAELEIDCTNTDSDITFTAQAAGAAGNNITVKYVDPGAASQSLGVVVVGDAITVNLETDADGFIISTAAGIANFINTDLSAGAVAAAALVVAAAEGVGGGVVGTAAELEVDCTNSLSDVTFTAVDTGMAGNNITVKYVDPGVASQALSIDVTGNAITVNLATGADGSITSTAADIATAVNADAAALLIVSALEDGAGVVDITTDSEQLSGGGGAAAELTVDCTNLLSDVTCTAVAEGIAGNNITVKYVDPGAASQALSVDVISNAITVNLATDSTGAIISTAEDIADAINADTDAALLVSASGEGTGVVGSKAELTVDCTNADSDVTFTAVNTGTASNDISVKYVDPGAASQALSVNVDDNVITVNLATGVDGSITSTAAEIANFINTDLSSGAVAARLLVSALEEGIGSGVVDITTGSENLSGGGGAAELIVDCTDDNSSVTYTAVNGGIAGNDISIKYVDPVAASQALSVNVDDNVITVNLATDSTGAISSTAAEIAAAINFDAYTALLVFASAENEGDGVVTVADQTSLTGGVDVADNTPDTYSNTITAYDSKGSAVDVTMQYTCVGQGRWVWDVTSSDGLSSSTGVISFDENGKLSYPATNPEIEITGFSNGADDLDIEWDLVGNDNFAGYALVSSTSSQTQNGYAAGTLQSVSVDEEGFVVKAYSNGQLIPGYKIALAGFSSYDNLARTGDNLYSESLASGQPTFGIPGSGGLGGINSRSLEMSNVDLATEFVRMITTQRAFQASSRVITTSDEILQELINLKR